MTHGVLLVQLMDILVRGRFVSVYTSARKTAVSLYRIPHESLMITVVPGYVMRAAVAATQGPSEVPEKFRLRWIYNRRPDLH